MEDERVRDQAEAARREEAARLESQARAQAEQEAREREEAERLREAERKEREAAARVDAIRRAAVEAARHEAEGRVLAEDRERERRHELRKLELTRVERESGRRVLAAGVLGLVVAGAAAGALYAGIVQPGERARAAQSSSELAARDARITEARSDAAKAEELAQSLTAALAVAHAESARLQKQLDDMGRQGAARTPAGTPAVVHRTPRSEIPIDGFTNCPPGSKDPLCAH